MEIITKQIPKRFLVIDGIEMSANEVFLVVEKFECDSEYHYTYFEDNSAVDDLVKVGVIGKRYGERQAIIYIKNEKTDDFIKEFWRLYNQN